MPAVSFRADVSELIREIDRFGAEAPKAQARALNTTMVAAQREAIERLADAMGLPLGVVSKQTGVVKATPDRLEAELVVAGERIPAIKFQASEDAQGVTYRVGGRAVTIAHGFIARTRSGHLGVFRRARGETRLQGGARRGGGATGLVGRLPIFERRGPAVGAFLERPEVFNPVKDVTERTLIEALDAELDKLQQRSGRG